MFLYEPEERSSTVPSGSVASLSSSRTRVLASTWNVAHMERRMVGERGGHAVQHIAQHPAARHPCAERQAAGKLRRAVYQCGDKPDDDEIRNKRAGNAQQRRKDAQSVLAVPPFCQLCQPRGGGALLLRGNSSKADQAARCFFTMPLPIAAPMNAATITPATSATDTQDCSIWDAARMAS